MCASLVRDRHGRPATSTRREVRLLIKNAFDIDIGHVN
jgi:hypothetical protein